MIGREEDVIVENSQLYFKRVLTAVLGVKGNLIDTNGPNNLVLQRDEHCI